MNDRRRGILETAAQTLRFLAVSAVNFVFTFLVFTLALMVFRFDYVVSLVAAWFVGMIFMYVTNFVWVFRLRDPLTFDSRFLKFLAVGLISITLNALALRYAVERLDVRPFLAQWLLLPAVAAFNFTASKFFALRTKPSRNAANA